MTPRTTWMVIMAWSCAGVIAADNPNTTPNPSPQLREDANNFAASLMQFATQVQRHYVRDLTYAVLLEAALGGLYEAARQPTPPNLRRDLEAALERDALPYLRRVRIEIGDHECVREKRAMYVAAKAMARVLDPYSGVTGAREFLSFIEETRFGIGVEFANAPWPDQSARRATNFRRGDNPATPIPPLSFTMPDALAVKTVVAGSPAQKAGLRPGDSITRVDGRTTRELTSRRYYRTFFPDANDEESNVAHRLQYLRPGVDAARDVTVTPAEFDPECVFGVRRRSDDEWDFIFDARARLGYIRVGAIGTETHSEFQAALRDLAEQKCAGLLLDLRWCPGGFLTQAKAVARSLVSGDQPIAQVTYRNESEQRFEREFPVERFTDWPLLVLVNGETSGGGELIAAALQDQRRAVIAGDRTAGKASVQRELEGNPLDIPFKISIGTFHRPNGKELQRLPTSKPTDDWGVRPDEGRAIPTSPALAKQLKTWWTCHVLRPAGSTDSLPTDDPECDAQLQAAIQILKSMVQRAKS